MILKKKIYHIGRFAISRNTGANGYVLFKKLITLAIYSICQDKNGIMIAECDKKLLKTLTLLGIKTKILAQPISYLGSDTFPIYATTEWLKVFLTNNEHLQEIEKIVTDRLYVNPELFTKAPSVNLNKLEGSFI